jgi:hypothetical protein
MRWTFALFVLATPLAGTTVEAQTLSVRPAPFTDLRPGSQPRYGEVVLGRTTMTAALRMFADDLSSDSVRVPRGHPSNPSPYPAGIGWHVGSHHVRPQQQLDLGPERYTLYFDENERLIAAITARVPGGLTREMLNAHYPSLQRGRRWYSGDQPRMDQWSVAVSDCVTLTAHVLVADERVESLSYLYTCPTQSGKLASPRP